jgi:hypothetical protein
VALYWACEDDPSNRKNPQKFTPKVRRGHGKMFTEWRHLVAPDDEMASCLRKNWGDFSTGHG